MSENPDVNPGLYEFLTVLNLSYLDFKNDEPYTFDKKFLFLPHFAKGINDYLQCLSAKINHIKNLT